MASCLWVDEAIESQLYLDGIVCVVDAKHISRHIDTRRHDIAGDGDGSDLCGEEEAPRRHTEEAYRQLCVADRLLLNKTDLVQAPDTLLRLERDLRALNGMAAIRRTAFSRVELDFVLGLDCYGQVVGGGGAGSSSVVPPFLFQMPDGEEEEEGGGACCDDDKDGGPCRHDHHHEHTREVTTLALVEPGLTVDADAVRQWLGGLLWQEEEEDGGHGGRQRAATEIYRMKGVLAVAGSEAVHILQAVHETFEVEPSRSLTWGGKEAGPKGCRVVVIGRGLDEACFRRGLLATSRGDGGGGGGGEG